MKLLKSVTFVTACVTAGLACAASDGALAGNSNGAAALSLEIGSKVRVRNVDDIPLGTYSGVGDLTANMSYCVYRSGGEDYRMKLSTDQGAFQVYSTLAAASISYLVRVDDDLDASDGEILGYDSWSAASMTGHERANCQGQENGSIWVSFFAANLQAAPTASDYQTTMILTIEPI